MMIILYIDDKKSKAFTDLVDASWTGSHLDVKLTYPVIASTNNVSCF